MRHTVGDSDGLPGDRMVSAETVYTPLEIASLHFADVSLRQMAEALRVGAFRADGERLLAPKPGNPWGKEIPELVDAAHECGAFGRSQAVTPDRTLRLAHKYTLLWVRTVADLLPCLLPSVSSRAGHSLARVVLEAACKTIWLNQPNADPSDLLRRAVMCAHNAARQSALVLKRMPDGLPIVDDEYAETCRKQRTADETERNCWKRLADTLTRVHGGKTPDASRPTSLVCEMIAWINANVGQHGLPEASYALLSDSIHASGSIAQMHNDQPLGDGWTTVSAPTRLQPAVIAARASAAMAETVDRMWCSSIDVRMAARCSTSIAAARDAVT